MSLNYIQKSGGNLGLEGLQRTLSHDLTTLRSKGPYRGNLFEYKEKKRRSGGGHPLSSLVTTPGEKEEERGEMFG